MAGYELLNIVEEHIIPVCIAAFAAVLILGLLAVKLRKKD